MSLARILPLLQLTRFAMVFTAIADIWLIAFLGRWEQKQMHRPDAAATLAAWQLLLLTALVGFGLYTFGMALNDLMDARHDRTFAPDRPIPAGRISQVTGIVVALVALMVAIFGSVLLGPVNALICLLAAATILFYDAAGKFLPTIGLISLGIVRALNMLIADPAVLFIWPIWLSMTHIIALSTLCHRLEGKRPVLQPQDLWAVIAGWAFCSMILIGWMSYREPLLWRQMHYIWIGPVIAVLVFVFLVSRHVWPIHDHHRRGRALMKLGLLWLIVYDAAWLFSAGLWKQGILVAAMMPAAYLAMVSIRQLEVAVACSPVFRRPQNGTRRRPEDQTKPRA